MMIEIGYKEIIQTVDIGRIHSELLRMPKAAEELAAIYADGMRRKQAIKDKYSKSGSDRALTFYASMIDDVQAGTMEQESRWKEKYPDFLVRYSNFKDIPRVIVECKYVLLDEPNSEGSRKFTDVVYGFAINDTIEADVIMELRKQDLFDAWLYSEEFTQGVYVYYQAKLVLPK